MIIKTMFKLITVIISGVIFFSLLSCDDEGQSIFWTIINAQEEVDYSLNNNISIISMTDDGGNYYISTGGAIYWQETSLTDKDWTKISFPDNAIYCTSLVHNGSGLYAGFIFENNTSSGLYVSSTPTADPPNWTRENDEDINGKQIIKIIYENTQLFISLQEPRDPPGSEEPFDYSLYYFNGSDYLPVNALTDKARPITDITWDTSEYWAVTGSAIYKGAAGTMTLVPDDPSTDVYHGILYVDSTGSYYVSSEHGNVYKYDGSEWSSNGIPVEINGEVVSFTGLAEVNDNILVGTHGYGFFEMRTGALGSLTRAEMDSILSSDLYTSHVLSFKITAPNTVFFCTGANGLYHNTYDGNTWAINWVRE